MDNIQQITQVIANVGILTFVVASMAALGLSLSVRQIVQPLRNGRLVAMVLLANFVLTPALAYAIKTVIPMDEGYAIGLILLRPQARLSCPSWFRWPKVLWPSASVSWCC